jgi:deoxyribonuclease IV
LKDRLLVGYHLSIAGSLDGAFDRAEEIGCTAFQIFTRSPRQWAFKALTDGQVGAFAAKRESTGLKSTVVHMPYLPNLASPDPATMKKSRLVAVAEAGRCDQLGVPYLVVHLGSHLGEGAALGVRDVAGACRDALGETSDVTVLLENMAGQKNAVGARFEELAEIIRQADGDRRLGVCFDTCHAFAAGFDLRSPGAVAQSMGLFSDVVGFDRLKVVHLNDSKGKLGDHLDRHEYVGEGQIGMNGMRAFLRHPRISKLPLIMEVPYDDDRDPRKDLALVRSLAR